MQCEMQMRSEVWAQKKPLAICVASGVIDFWQVFLLDFPHAERGDYY